MHLFKRKKTENRRKSSRLHNRNLVATALPEREIFNLIDISETGLQFSSPHDFKKKEVLDLTINLAEADVQIQARSHVAWVRSMVHQETKVYRVGVNFVDLSQEARQVIRNLAKPILKAA